MCPCRSRAISSPSIANLRPKKRTSHRRSGKIKIDVQRPRSMIIGGPETTEAMQTEKAIRGRVGFNDGIREGNDHLGRSCAALGCEIVDELETPRRRGPRNQEIDPPTPGSGYRRRSAREDGRQVLAPCKSCQFPSRQLALLRALSKQNTMKDNWLSVQSAMARPDVSIDRWSGRSELRAGAGHVCKSGLRGRRIRRARSSPGSSGRSRLTEIGRRLFLRQRLGRLVVALLLPAASAVRLSGD